MSTFECRLVGLVTISAARVFSSEFVNDTNELPEFKSNLR